MWFLCTDVLDPETSKKLDTTVLGVFDSLSDCMQRVARCFFDIPLYRLYVVASSSEQYWLRCSGFRGVCSKIPKDPKSSCVRV